MRAQDPRENPVHIPRPAYLEDEQELQEIGL